MKLKKDRIKTLKKKAWEAISRFVRQRDPLCVACMVEGKQVPSAHCSHFRYNSERNQTLGGNALWYDIRNLNGCCVGCNLYKSGNLASYALYLEMRYGHGILQELHELWDTPKKFTEKEIQEIVNMYAVEL